MPFIMSAFAQDAYTSYVYGYGRYYYGPDYYDFDYITLDSTNSVCWYYHESYGRWANATWYYAYKWKCEFATHGDMDFKLIVKVTKWDGSSHWVAFNGTLDRITKGTNHAFGVLDILDGYPKPYPLGASWTFSEYVP